MTMRACAVVPSRNHHRDVGRVVAAARAAGLPVFVIDDGSDEPARGALAALHDPEAEVTVIRLDRNAGKGAAVIAAFRRAAAAGFTHAIQLDADGQHDLAALPRLLRIGTEHPDALVLGHPRYDASVPRARELGRRFTNLWVWIETLSCRITDAMCGFRLYPLAPALAVADGARLSPRMAFDIDIAVRLSWRGVPVRMLPVGVTYPAGNISNFDMLRDNWRITALHTRLVFGMLVRLPALLARRASTRHWSDLAERGAGWGLDLLARVYRIGGRDACLALLFPVATYFHLTGGARRRAARDFLERALARRGERPRPGDGLRHTLDFAVKGVETAAAWRGDIARDRMTVDDPASLAHAVGGGGAVLIVSHLGNVELSRALLPADQRARITLLHHTRHAEHYNRIMRRLNPDAAINALEVTEIGPAEAITLQERIARGAWIAIAGDRTPPGGGRVSRVRFLGAEAPLPQGPYVLAHLLRCPVYLLFCLREGRGWRLHLEPFADRVELPVGDKRAAIDVLAQRYADRLEAHAVRAPFQWYNFFEFWPPP